MGSVAKNEQREPEQPVQPALWNAKWEGYSPTAAPSEMIGYLSFIRGGMEAMQSSIIAVIASIADVEDTLRLHEARREARVSSETGDVMEALQVAYGELQEADNAEGVSDIQSSVFRAMRAVERAIEVTEEINFSPLPKPRFFDEEYLEVFRDTLRRKDLL